MYQKEYHYSQQVSKEEALVVLVHKGGVEKLWI